MAVVRMSRALVNTVADNAKRVFESKVVPQPPLNYSDLVDEYITDFLESPHQKTLQKIADALTPAEVSLFMVRSPINEIWIDYNTYSGTSATQGKFYWRFKHEVDRVAIPPNSPVGVKIRERFNAWSLAGRKQNQEMYERREQVAKLLQQYPSMNKFLIANPAMKDLVPDHVLERIREPSSRVKTGTVISDAQKELLANLRNNLVAEKLKDRV